MRMAMYGHEWQPPAGVNPTLIAARHYYHPPMAVERRCQQLVWALDYVISGASDYRLSPTAPWRTREPHTAHLYPPNTPYWERLPGGAASSMRSAYIIFTGGEAAGLEALLHPGERFAEFQDTEDLLAPLLQQTAEVGQAAGADGYWAAQSHFCTILHHLRHSVPNGPGQFTVLPLGQHPGVSDFVHAVNAHLQTHLAERVTLEDVAAALHVSASTLSHRYRAETGIAPMRHLLELRVAAAKALLPQGFPLKDIATLTGFCDAFHLSKAFKHLTGISPRAYLPHQQH